MHRAESMAPYEAAESLRLQSVMLGGPADPTAFLTSYRRLEDAGSPGFETPRGSQMDATMPRTPRAGVGSSAAGETFAYAQSSPNGHTGGGLASSGYQTPRRAGPYHDNGVGTPVSMVPSRGAVPPEGPAVRGSVFMDGTPSEQPLEGPEGFASPGPSASLDREGFSKASRSGVARSSGSLTARFSKFLSRKSSVPAAVSGGSLFEGGPAGVSPGGAIDALYGGSPAGAPPQASMSPSKTRSLVPREVMEDLVNKPSSVAMIDPKLHPHPSLMQTESRDRENTFVLRNGDQAASGERLDAEAELAIVQGQMGEIRDMLEAARSIAEESLVARQAAGAEIDALQLSLSEAQRAQAASEQMADMARGEATQWQTEAEQLRSAVQQLHESEQHQKQDLQAAVESLRKCRLEKDELEGDLLRVERSQHQQAVDSSAGLAQLNLVIERLVNSEKELKARLETAEEEAKHWQAEALQSATQIEQLQQSEQQARRELHACREELSRWQAENLQLKAQIDELQKSDEQHKEVLLGAEDDLEFWQTENAELRGELERKENAELEQKEAFQTALEAAQTSLMEGTTALEQAQETISALESEVTMLRSDSLQQKATAAAREAALEHESAVAKESLQIIERELSDLKRQLHTEREAARLEKQHELSSFQEMLQAKILDAEDKVIALDQLLARSSEEIASRDETIRHINQQLEALHKANLESERLFEKGRQDRRMLESQQSLASISLQAELQNAAQVRASLEERVKVLHAEAREAAEQIVNMQTQISNALDWKSKTLMWKERYEMETQAHAASKALHSTQQGILARQLEEEKSKALGCLAEKEHISEELRKSLQTLATMATACQEQDGQLHTCQAELVRVRHEHEALLAKGKHVDTELREVTSVVHRLLETLNTPSGPDSHQAPVPDWKKVVGDGHPTPATDLEACIPAARARLSGEADMDLPQPKMSLAQQLETAVQNVTLLLEHNHASSLQREQSLLEMVALRKGAADSARKLELVKAEVKADQEALALHRSSEISAKSEIFQGKETIARLEEKLSSDSVASLNVECALREVQAAETKLRDENKQLSDANICAVADLESALQQLEASTDELELAKEEIAELQAQVNALKQNRGHSCCFLRRGVEVDVDSKHECCRCMQPENLPSARSGPAMHNDVLTFKLLDQSNSWLDQTHLQSALTADSLPKCTLQNVGDAAQSNFEAAQNALETMRVAIAQAAQHVADGKVTKQQNATLAMKLQEAHSQLAVEQDLLKESIEEVRVLQQSLVDKQRELNVLEDELRYNRALVHEQKAASKATQQLANELQDRQQSTNNEVQILKGKLAAAELSAAREGERAQAKALEVSKLQTELQSTMRELEMQRLQNESMQTSYQADVSQARNAHRDLTHQVEKGLKQIEILEMQLTNARDDLSKARVANLDADADLKNQDIIMQSLQSELNLALQREKHAADRLAHMDDTIKAKHVSLEALQESLESTQRQLSKATGEYQFQCQRAANLEAQLQGKIEEVLELQRNLHSVQSKTAEIESALACKASAEAQLTEELQRVRNIKNQLEFDMKSMGDLNSTLTRQAHEAKLSEQQAVVHAQAIQNELAASKSKYEVSLRHADDNRKRETADIQQRAQHEVQAERHESNKLRSLVEDLTLVLTEKEDELAAAVDALAQVSNRLQAADVEAAAARAVCTRAHAAISTSTSCPVTPRFLGKAENIGQPTLTYRITNTSATMEPSVRTASLLGFTNLGGMSSFPSMQLRTLQGDGKLEMEGTSQHHGSEYRSTSAETQPPLADPSQFPTSVSSNQSGRMFEHTLRAPSDKGWSYGHRSSIHDAATRLSDLENNQHAFPLQPAIWDKQALIPARQSLPTECKHEKDLETKQLTSTSEWESAALESVSGDTGKLVLGANTNMQEPEVPKLNLHAVQARNSALIRTKRAEQMQSRQSQVENGRKKIRTSSFALPSRVSKIS
eukprot:jgi/Botrbrau1/73/Bobra.0022s0065.2